MHTYLRFNLHGLSDFNIILEFFYHIFLNFLPHVINCFFFFFLFIEISGVFPFHKKLASRAQPYENPAGKKFSVNFHFEANKMQNEDMEIIPWSINI